MFGEKRKKRRQDEVNVVVGLMVFGRKGGVVIRTGLRPTSTVIPLKSLCHVLNKSSAIFTFKIL